MNIIPYLFSWRMLDQVKILPANTEYNGKTVEIPHGELGEGKLWQKIAEISTETAY